MLYGSRILLKIYTEKKTTKWDMPLMFILFRQLENYLYYSPPFALQDIWRQDANEVESFLIFAMRITLSSYKNCWRQ